MRHILFLSHAGVDAEAARKLADRIETTPEARKHGLKIWIDKRDLEPGSGWQQQLERAIEERSTAFAVYIGATGAINWVDSEVRLALSRAQEDPDYRFIPIISASASGSGALPGFARQYQGVLDVENRPEELAKLIRAAVGAEANGPAQLVDEPFPGLRAFDEQHTHLFFGRETETEELVQKLRREPLLMVVGDSGSGKSSLVRAGLLPRFRGGALADQSGDQPDDTIWHVVTARPRGQPFEALADAVFSSGETAGVDIVKLGTCKDWIRMGRPEKVRDGLIHGAPPKAQILLVIDQFEELLTQGEDASRQSYIDALLGLVADPGDRTVRIVMTMRYDYYNLCSQFPAFFERLEGKEGRSKYPLERMKEEGLRACVQEPLRLAGVLDTETLANEVVTDIGERAGNLALLQTALKEAWHERRQVGNDLLAAYVRVGRVTGALANAANEVFQNRLSEDEKKLAEVAFMRLVRLGDTGGTARRVATRGEFSDDAWTVVQKLATEECRRLLFIGGEPGKDTVELAHDALATQWPRYQIWLHEAAGDKRRLDRLIDRVEHWQATGEKVEDLASGTEREEFHILVQTRPTWLAPLEYRFVKASERAHQEEQDRKEKARLRELSLISWLKRGAMATAAVALVAMVAGASAWFQREAAVRARDLAEKQAVAAEAARSRAEFGDALYRAEQAHNELKGGNAGSAMLLALAGLPEEPGSPSARAWVGETAGALVEAMGAQRELETLRGHEGEVRTATFSPDGARIASGSDDGTVRVWDAASGLQRLVLRGHAKGVLAAEFSPDGAQITSGSADGTVRVWDAARGAELLVLRGHRGPVSAAAFSPDGQRIVSGSDDDTIRVWDARRGTELLVLQGHKGDVWAAAFSPDGVRIVSGSQDGTARVWDAKSGKELLTLRGHGAMVNAAVFSPDGARIASGSGDGTVRIWDAAGGEELLVLHGQRHEVWGVAFSPNGARIVSGSRDGWVRVWSAANGQTLLAFRGHTEAVASVAFSPDGTRIASGSGDTTIKLWDAVSADDLCILRGHEGDVLAAAFSPDGARIVSGSWDNTVRVWDAASGEELLVLRGHEDGVWAATFSPDGARIVSGSADDTVRVWDVASGKDRVVLRGHEGDAVAVAFSPDGARIVSGSDDGTVRIWDAASGEELLVLRGHEDHVWAAAFSPDGAQIVSGSADDTVRVWDPTSGKDLRILRGHAGDVRAAAFSPDGARIVSGSADDTIRVWNAASGEDLRILRGHEGDVLTVAVSPDGARIVSGSWDNTVRVWDVASGEELLVLRGHEGNVWAAGFSPDGARIVSGSDDQTVRSTWIGRSKQELIETARAQMPRELNEEERRQFHLDVE